MLNISTDAVDQALQAARQCFQSNPARSEELCRQVLAQFPANPDALHLLGALAFATGHHDAAISLFTQALALRPAWAEAWFDLALACQRASRIADAEAHYRAAISARPDYAEAFNNLGNILRQQGRSAEAVDFFQRGIASAPQWATIRINAAQALRDVGRLHDAVEEAKAAVALEPAMPQSHLIHGVILAEAGQTDLAMDAYRRAIQLAPDLAEAHVNLGGLLRKRDQLAAALDCFQRAMALQPGYGAAWANAGVVLMDMVRLPEAIAHLQKAVQIEPNNAESHNMLGMALLLTGDFENGWREHDWRWKTQKLGNLSAIAQPRWDGSPLAGRTLLLVLEQGLGDAIQFIRYLPLVAGRGAGRIIIEGPEPLRRLFEHLPYVDQWIPREDPIPAFDIYAPLLSLPFLLNTRADFFPAAIPYISAPQEDVRRLGGRMAPKNRLNVGLNWSGNVGFPLNHRRSMTLAQLAPLADVSGVRFFTLQMGEPGKQATSPPPGMDLIDLTSELRDLADTAALMTNLDLVISTDTGVLHLAGALGVPTWAMLSTTRDWRWLLDRADSPWYPTMRLYRQKSFGDWAPVVEQVTRELRQFASGAVH